jgi:peptide/nickel transport system permease protein
VWDTEQFRVLSAPTRLPPSLNYEIEAGKLAGQVKSYPFGTDTQGRDLLAVAIKGTPLTLRIGLIAGFVSIGLGTVAAFLAAYYRGWVDTGVRTVVDVGLAMPGLLILILVRINIGRELSVDEMGFALGMVGWVFPARTIRAQVLVMREQAYVQLSRLSGTSGMGIIFKEMLPNLIPYITASLVASVAGAILASIGLEAIGLGKFGDPTLGMTIYWNIQFSSIILGMWWWWLPPLVAIVIVFLGLFLISSGLDEWSNPRLRKRV